MNRVIYSVLLIFAAINASSQITKQNWLIGGAASFRASKYEFGGNSSKQSNLELTGDVGYFIIDKFAIGIKPAYSRSKLSYPVTIVNTYEIGPFARYYLLPTERSANIFSELSYQYGFMKTNQGVSQNSNNFSGVVGCSLFFNNSVALEFTLGFSSYLYNRNQGKVNSFIAGIGFHFHLEKEK